MHVVADVVVANNAAVGIYTVNVISGFQVMSVPGALMIVPANYNLPTPVLPVYNAVSYATVLHDADYGSIFGANLAISPSSAQVFLNGTAVPVLYGANNQVNFQVPEGFPVGPATLMLNNGAANAYPVYVQIDSPPAVVSVQGSSGRRRGVAVGQPGRDRESATHRCGPGIVNSPGRVKVLLSNVPMSVLSVTAGNAGAVQVQFAVTQSFAGWQVPLVVCVDGSPSLSLTVTAK